VAQSAGNNLVKLVKQWHRAVAAKLESLIDDPINVAYDDKFGRLLIFNSKSNQLAAVPGDGGGELIPGSIERYNAKSFGVLLANGMAVDPQSGALFILDSAGAVIVRVEPDVHGNFDNALISQISLQSSGLTDLRGIAFDPAVGNLHVLASGLKKLYELN
jgi:hypothetical protein